MTPGERVAATMQRLVRPSRPLSAQIGRLTGISDAQLAREGVDPCEAIDELVAFIGDDPIVAYNARLDLAFLHAACEHHRVLGDTDGVHSCARALARRTWLALSSHKLGHVAARLGAKMDGQHRALGDAQRAANVYLAASIEHWICTIALRPRSLPCWPQCARRSPGAPGSELP